MNNTWPTKQNDGQTTGALIPFLQNYGAYLAFGQALVAMLGSLYYSEIAGLIPCTLCWYQRILMYPLVLITLVGLIKHDEYLPSYVLPLSIIGIGMSTYHYLIQLGVLGNTSGCSIVACNVRYVNYLGFITIPFMALTGFIVITVAMLATRWANGQVEME